MPSICFVACFLGLTRCQSTRKAVQRAVAAVAPTARVRTLADHRSSEADWSDKSLLNATRLGLRTTTCESVITNLKNRTLGHRSKTFTATQTRKVNGNSLRNQKITTKHMKHGYDTLDITV
jgi:hypothetical protein